MRVGSLLVLNCTKEIEPQLKYADILLITEPCRRSSSEHHATPSSLKPSLKNRSMKHRMPFDPKPKGKEVRTMKYKIVLHRSEEGYSV